MTESEAISCLKADKEYLVDMKVFDGEEIDVAIKALEEVEQYRAIGTVDEIKFNMEELKRWHTDTINPKIKNVFANTSTLICHNCDHKNEYIEELEAEMEEYHAIGTPDECRAAVEKQKAKKPPVVNRPSIFVKVPVCPNCSTPEHYQSLYGKTKYCSNCGQKLDWSDEE